MLVTKLVLTMPAIFIAILIATGVALLLIRFSAFRLWKVWYFISIFITLLIAFGAFIPELIALTNNGWNDVLNELTRRLHGYDEIARVLQIEKNVLEKKLREILLKKEE